MAKKEKGLIRGETVAVPVDQVKPNAWNWNRLSPARMANLTASLRKHGQIRPVIVREVKDGKTGKTGKTSGKGKRYELINGEHTWKALGSLKAKHVLVQNLGMVADRTAKRLSAVTMEARYGENDAGALDAVLAELGAEFDLGDLLEDLPFSEDEITNAGKESDAAVDASEDTASQGSQGEVDEDGWRTIVFRVPEPIYQTTLEALAELSRDVAKSVPVEVRNGLALERLVADHRAGRPGGMAIPPVERNEVTT